MTKLMLVWMTSDLTQLGLLEQHYRDVRLAQAIRSEEQADPNHQTRFSLEVTKGRNIVPLSTTQ